MTKDKKTQMPEELDQLAAQIEVTQALWDHYEARQQAEKREGKDGGEVKTGK